MADARLSANDYTLLDQQLRAFDPESQLVETYELEDTQGFARAPYLDISAALDRIPQPKSGPGHFSRLEIYADTVVATTQIVLHKEEYIWVIIYARDLFPGSSPENPARIKFEGQGGGTIILLSDFRLGAPSLEVTAPNGQTFAITPGHDEGSFGSKIDIDATSAVNVLTSLTIPEEMFNAKTIADQLNDRGLLLKGASRRLNDDLSRIVSYQMLLATYYNDTRPTVALSISNCVIAATRGIAKAFPWNLQASTLATRQMATGGLKQRYVPRLDLSVTREVLISRLSAAAAFENAFEALRGQEANATSFETMAMVTFQAAVDTENMYADLAERAKTRLDDALGALKDSQKTFKTLKEELDKAGKTFEKGIKEWKQKELAKAIGTAAIAVIVVVGTIAVAVVAPPLAPAGVGAAGEGLTVATEGAEAVAKAATTFEKLKKLFDKLKPGLEKIGSVVEAMRKLYEVVGAMSKTEKINPEESRVKLPSAEGTGADTINMDADWSAFDVDMREMFEHFKEYDIEGKDEYSRIIYNMPVRGKAVLSCQNAVAQAFNDYYQLVLQVQYARRQTERLRQAIASLQGDPLYLHIFKLAMLDRLIDIRSWITMDLQSYVAAYAWYSLDQRAPIQINPVKPLQDLQEDAAKLQSAVAQADERILAQQKTFRLRASAADAPLGSSWKEDLIKDRAFTFSIPLGSATFADYDRVRISRVRCYLSGVEAAEPGSSIAVAINSDALFLDRTPSSSHKKNKSSRRDIGVAFVLPATRLVFEYTPDNGGNTAPEIVMDGQYSKMASYVQASPFTSWTLRLLSAAVDIANVQDVVIEMQCQVTVRL